MFERLSIEHFRGIASLQLDGLSRINVFTGRNGCGKTSVLEAAVILANPTQPAVLINLAQCREMPPPNLRSDLSLRSYFRDLDLAVAIKLRVDIGAQRRIVEISAIRDGPRNIDAAAPDGNASAVLASGFPDATGVGSAAMNGVQYRLSSDNALIAPAAPVHIQLLPAGTQVFGAPPGGLGHTGSFYVHARRANSIAETANILTRLNQNRKESLLLEVLHSVQPTVIGVFPGTSDGQPMVSADLGGPVRLPVQLLGDGFCRVLLIAAGIVGAGAKVVAVDEVDSGLHYSAMEDFWRAVGKVCRQSHVQMFCSTHNEEMLKAVLSAFDDHPEDIALFRIDRSEDGKVTAHRYDHRLLRKAEAMNLEVR